MQGHDENVNLEGNINDICGRVSKILVSAAEDSGLIITKRINNKKCNKRKIQPWFNEDCKLKRQSYFKAKHNFRRINSQRNYDEMVLNSTNYKKQIKKEFRMYQNNISNKLMSLRHSDPKAYWNLLNKYSGKKREILKKVSSEVFYEHFSKLNTVETDEENVFDMTKVSHFNNELNCPFTADGISKSISNLKNQKTCSAEDYILHEYIK